MSASPSADLRDHVAVTMLDPACASAAWLARERRHLTPEERRRADGFKLPRLAHDHLCTRVLQRLTLSGATGVAPGAWRFEAAPGGRPEIAEPAAWRDLRFSLSHTRSLIACAVTRAGALGIDVEHRANAADVGALARRFFADEEARMIAGLAPGSREDRFLDLWTLKEACLKALGTGLATPLSAVRIESVGEPQPVVRFGPEIASDSKTWQFASCRPTPDHWMALAVRRGARADVDIVTGWLIGP